MKTYLTCLALMTCGMLSAQVEIDQPIVLTGINGDRSIQQLEAPVNGTDAVNKDYVDNAVSAGGGSIPTMLSDESVTTMNFGSALRYCRDLVEGGNSDWYLPKLSELVHVYSRGQNPVSNDTSTNYVWAFAIQGANLWDYIHIFRLSDGAITVTPAGTSSYRARCVR